MGPLLKHNRKLPVVAYQDEMEILSPSALVCGPCTLHHHVKSVETVGTRMTLVTVETTVESPTTGVKIARLRAVAAILAVDPSMKFPAATPPAPQQKSKERVITHYEVDKVMEPAAMALYEALPSGMTVVRQSMLNSELPADSYGRCGSFSVCRLCLVLTLSR